MRLGVLAHTTVPDGHWARAASSVVYWPASSAPGAPAFKAGFDGCHHGNREPDCEAGAGAGAGAGAKPPEVEAVELWRLLHCDRNCGQLRPPVVPAALASFHWLAHVLMALWPPEGAAAVDVGAGVDGCDQGNKEPD
jgi:hypothetical protein